MTNKLEISKKVMSCLDVYCQTAFDKDKYNALVKEFDDRLEKEIVQSIQIPADLMDIVSFAEKLNPYANVFSWRAFLQQRTTIQADTSAVTSSPTQLLGTSSDIWITSSSLTSRTSLEPTDEEPVSKTSEPNNNTCVDILGLSVQIFEQYHATLQNICTSINKFPIQLIISFFPDIQQAKYDIELLEELLDPVVKSQLHSIISFWKNRSQINHICMGFINITAHVSATWDLTFIDKIRSIDENTSGEECTIIYKQYQDHIQKLCSERVCTLVSYYSSSEDLFKFIYSLKTEDVYNMQEAVNDWDETVVNTKTIFDFTIVKNFIDRAYADMNTKRQQLTNTPFHLTDVVASFNEVWKNNQFSDLLKCLESSALGLSTIKRVYLELTNKEKSKRHYIAKILKNSSIHFVRTGDHEIIFDVHVEHSTQTATTNDENKQKQVNFSDLSEIRDRVRLMEYSSHFKRMNASDMENKAENVNLCDFIRLVDIIESSLEILNALYTVGHPFISTFVESRQIFSCIDGVYGDLQQNNIMLNCLLEDWEKKLCDIYQRHVILTYFLGDQLWQIEDYIYNRSSSSHPGYHLLKFVDIDPNSLPCPSKQRQEPEDRLANLVRWLPRQQVLPFREEKNPKIKKCLLIETTNEGILRAILSLFSFTTTPAKVHRIFYCTSHTNWMQIRAFIYRCFYSQSLHQLIRPELLSQSIQDQFIYLLRSLIDQRPQHFFQMGIITTTASTEQQIINELQSMDVLKIFHDHELLNSKDFDKEINALIRECTVVTSKLSGLGKSTFIRQTMKKSKMNYVKFPIYGDLDSDILAERLCSLCPELQTGALHLDIGTVDNSQRLNEILYCLLLFRSFRFGQIAISLPAETCIFIELDASPDSSLTEIPLFHHIKTIVHIDHIDWTSLIVDNVEIQTITNYLDAINREDIVNNNVNPSNFKNFDQITCSTLIQKVFLKNKKTDFTTWTQLSIFIAVFYRLFTGFSRCSYFFPKYLENPRIRAIRMDLIQTLLQSSNQFTSFSVEAVRQQQRSMTTKKMTEFSDAIIHWEKMEPFTFVFTDTDDPIFVYKKPADVPAALVQYFEAYNKVSKASKRIKEKNMFPDYTKLSHTEIFIRLASLSRKYFNKAICPTCFRQYEFKEQHCQICSINNVLIRPKTFDDADILSFQTDIAERLRNEYVLTQDNFIKMLLIYMRVQCGIPVLIMGETGCGKTTLIQFLCQKILDEDLEVIRVHAGFTAKKIIKTMQVCITKAETSAEKGKRLWVFFDEFNTTTNIGLLKEIMCEKTLLGKSLPSNMIFLGACNPRRKKTLKIMINEDDDIGIRKTRYDIQKLLGTGLDRCLLYTVVPIPETMLEYIWDYGYLDESTETAYIKTMLNTCHNLSSNQRLFNLTVTLLVHSHIHFRDLEDVSSVSLRDIARFCRLYNWYLDLLNQNVSPNLRKSEYNYFLHRATFIALLLCYYFRLRSTKLKTVYINNIELTIKKLYPEFGDRRDYLIKYILKHEQKKLIDKKMELPEGISLNRALRDNIFVLFACIINRIPLFMCGKPGSSKSSAVQILINNLKGKMSKDSYFQTLPELVTVSFQGSQSCTSESIIQVFERANNYARVKNCSELLPVIVFDEIGLAELSPHNPLKVLHAELEVENNKYGFVGISNWRLDASKMNRALYLSTPDSDVKDLQLIGKTIVESMQQQAKRRFIHFNSIIINGLAEAYYDLYDNLRDAPPDQKNYFGLRDYYCLIKSIVRNLMETNEKTDIYEIIRRQLKVNFDGTLDGSLLLWQHFCQYINRNHLFNDYACPSFNSLLDQALKNRSSRYLMLIGDCESTIDYVERFINVHQRKHNIEVRTIVGSSFSGDLHQGNTYSKQYNYRVLMDTILYSETNITLMMRQMGHLYDNLYDLFNQNFAFSGRQKYCRIALGALYHPRCLIHDNFYCIVFIHQRDIDKCDPPFLNRFEKHVIEIQALIHARHQSIYNDLDLWLNNFFPKKSGQHFLRLQHLFVDYSQDRIFFLIMEIFEQLDISIDGQDTDEIRQEIIKHCQAKLMRTSSFDLPLVLSLQPTDENQTLIDQYYDIHRSITFSALVQQALESNNISPQIIYTYTQIFHQINTLPNGVEEIKLSAFKTELELKNKIKYHYQRSNTIRLLLIRVDYHNEHQHILSLKHVLLNESLSQSDRGVWLIFHLQRNLLNQTSNDILFSDWSTDMIDDLNDRVLFSKQLVLTSSYRDLVLQLECLLSDSIFDDLINRCLSKFRYIATRKTDEKLINVRRNTIFEEITRHSDDTTRKDIHLRSIMHENLIELIRKNEKIDKKDFTDWRSDLLTNSKIMAGSCSLQDAFQTIVSLYFEAHLLLLLAHVEKHNLFDAYRFLSTISDKNIEENLSKLWIDCLMSSMKTIDLTMMNHDIIDIKLVVDLKLPCAASEYEHIQLIRQKIRELQNINNDYTHFLDYAIKQILTTSSYGEDFMKLVLNNQQYFEFYLYDQIAIHLMETNTNLSSKFVFSLITSNPTRSFEQHIQLFLAHTELLDIIRLFDTSLQLIREEEILEEIQKQLVVQPTGEIRSSKFYTLVIKNEKFYQLPPLKTTIEDDCTFKCQGDPMIETSLMNLIELILSPSIINRVNNIQQLITTYSLIAQYIRDLESYQVNNLEKLRSSLSFISCLAVLLSDKAFDIFKQGFNAKFDSCQSIHQYVIQLRNIIREQGSTVNDIIIRQTLIKLEIELIKDWLADNEDSYGEVLSLLNENDNDLWQYSAKIFNFIHYKFDLISVLKEYHGRLPLDEKFEQFNHSLDIIDHVSHKIERLLVNQIHMHLMHRTSDNEIDQQLTDHYEHFEQNIYMMQNMKTTVNFQWISVVAWLKYYAQIYAFALNNESQNYIMPRIDQLLTNADSPFGSTLKLFIFKQLLQTSGRSLDDLRDNFVYRNLIWIKDFLQRPQDQEAQNIRQNLILPIPLFESREQFQRVSKTLHSDNNIDDLRQLIRECSMSQQLSYAFLCWFIQYYCRFIQVNSKTEDKVIHLILNDLNQEIMDSFTPLGLKLVIFLSSNFSNASYFHLDPTMPVNDIHKRLLALNIIAVLISLKSQRQMSLFGSFLFNDQREIPTDFIQHISNLYLPGLMISNPVITQMIHVRAQVQDHLKRGVIHDGENFIVKCSRECPWIFYLQDCNIRNDPNICPQCRKPIGITENNVLIERDPPQIQMSIDETFQMIDQYNKIARLGYHNLTTAEDSAFDEKPHHLSRSVSFRFLHFLTHALLLSLREFNYLADEDIKQSLHLSTATHFRDHFEHDYELLSQTFTNDQQCCIWLHKLLNHLVNDEFVQEGLMKTNEDVLQFERMIEERLIFPHMISVTNEIVEYKPAYAYFFHESNAQPSVDSFIHEVFEDEQQYPLLSFFNVTTFYKLDPLNEFIFKIQAIPYTGNTYPITTFILKRLDDYINIQHMYPIIVFTNYLIEKLNYRIHRNDANEKKMLYYLTKDKDQHRTNQLYNDFLNAWYAINLKEVHHGNQTIKFEKTTSKEKFAESTSINALLLNTSSDESSLLLVACLKTLAELQNEIVNYFHDTIKDDVRKETERKRLPLQSIRPEHIFNLDRNRLNQKLIDDCLVLNYQYGQGRDIIYDYEEIEIYLRNKISSLMLIDTDRLYCLNYQFESYGENTSLINDVRARIKQQRLSNDDRNKLQSLIVGMNNDDMLNYLGSLDYVFTYLRTSILDSASERIPIEKFVKHYIHRHTYLNDTILYQPPFSTIQLPYIIDLYEMIEENVFDRVLRAYVKNELQETTFTHDERQRIFEEFSHETFQKQTISPLLKNINSWISMFKHLMIRILSVNINLNQPLQSYLKQTDLWSDYITAADLATFQVPKHILLQHTYAILCALEREQHKSNGVRLSQNKVSTSTTDEQHRNVHAQQAKITKPIPITRVIMDKNRKIRT
ncbi:unnamed protein product [Rotaria sp. Silwood1]|nr:unnamed protein product [Rotaria sp. Silwood1]CAF1587418.1 unnamed protein product [Rotaria sp. Silwood1]